MNRTIYLLSFITLLFISCRVDSNNPSNDSFVKVQHVSTIDFQNAMQLPEATILDVRTIQEFQAGHIEGAINIDWYQRTFSNDVLHIPKDKPILIYCRTGNRTSKTTGVLQTLGFTNIYNLEKGIVQWIADNAPVTRNTSEQNSQFQQKVKTPKNETNIAHVSAGKIYNVSAVDFKKVVSLPNVSIVDIRTDQEFNSGYINGAVNIDWYQRSFKELIQSIPKDKPIAIYCRSGNRTSKAVNLLQSLGFTEIANLNYGIVEWNQYGFPLEK